MKNLLLSTALVISTAGFAAAGSHFQIEAQVENELALMQMDVDMDSLTEEQISQLYTTLTSTETASERDQKVRAVLNDWNVMVEDEEDPELALMIPRSQLRSLVYQKRGELGIEEIRVRTLTDDQLAALYLIANGNASDKQVQAKAIIN